MSSTATLSAPLGRLAFTVRLLVQGNPALGPALLATLAFVAMAGSEAGFYPSLWYGIALLTLALLVATVVAVGIPRDVPRTALAGVLAMAGFAVWQYLSITWAGDIGRALDGANRTLFYATVLALFAFWPWNPRGARLVLGAYGLGISAIAAFQLLKFRSDPVPYLIDGRFFEPAGYINANVAMWAMAMFPCLYLGAARELRPLSRGLFLGCAGLLSCVTLMGQSRGWFVAIPIALVFFVVLSRHWVRSLASVIAVAVATAAVGRSILDVRGDIDPAGLVDRAAAATLGILVIAAALVVVGALAAAAERRVKLSEGARRRGGRAFGALLLALVLIAGAVAVERTGNPVERASSSWTQFKDLDTQAAPGQSRFATGGTNRYDFWVVAWDVFREHPIGGVGADGFQASYLRYGKSDEQPRYAHSLELGVLAQTGVLGGLMAFGAMAALVVCGLRAVLRGYPSVGAAAGAAAATFAYWFLHGSVDWFWEFAGLGAPAMAMLGLSAGLAPRGNSPLPRPAVPTASLPNPALAAGGLAAALAVTMLAGPWVANLEIDRAAKGWRESPEGAFKRLKRARQLNPLSSQPDLVAGAIAVRLGRLDEAEAALGRARTREPDSSYISLQLGLIAAERDDRPTATALLRRANRLSPRDEITARALRELLSGRYVTAARINRLVLDQIQGSTNRP